eukprot:4271082-Amphidinium_carterae.1
MKVEGFAKGCLKICQKQKEYENQCQLLQKKCEKIEEDRAKLQRKNASLAEKVREHEFKI